MSCISWVIPDEIVEAFEDVREWLGAFVEKVKAAFEELHELATEARDVLEDWEREAWREAWREAALLAGQRAQARALSYNRQMQEEKALRALRRRKRLHNDGGLPDW